MVVFYCNDLLQTQTFSLLRHYRASGLVLQDKVFTFLTFHP